MNLDRDPRTLADLRIKLAHLRADQRDAEYSLALQKAKAEEAIIAKIVETVERTTGKIIEGAKALGANEDERKRTLVLRLEGCRDYQQALFRHHSVLGEIDLLTAQITSKEEEQRERERLTRQELVDALLGRRLDDTLADVILDLSRGPHRTTDRASDDRAWGEPQLPDPDEIRREIEDEIARERSERHDSSHSDIAEADLGETPAVDAATLQWELAAKAERARQAADEAHRAMVAAYDDEWNRLIGAAS